MKLNKLNLIKSLISKDKHWTKSNIPKTGAIAEHIACQFLTENKLKLIIKNYSCRQGEIDLIMQDQNELVFIEVRYRKNQSHGSALESITQYKLRRIKTAINHYIMTNNLGYIPCRIDVVGLNGNLYQPDIDWRKNILID